MEAGSGFWVFGFFGGRRHTRYRVPSPGDRPAMFSAQANTFATRNSSWTWLTAWFCLLTVLLSLKVNRLGVSVLMPLTRCSKDRQPFNQAVHKSVRRKGLRPSLLDEQALTKHTQTSATRLERRTHEQAKPSDPGVSPIKPVSPNRITTEQSKTARANIAYKQVNPSDVAAASMNSMVKI